MKVLIIGSGGREHVLAWKLKQSSRVKEIFCAPGNAGMEQVAKCIDIPAEDIKKLLQFVKKNNVDLTVVGPEAPLVAGIVDAFEKDGQTIFGPSKAAAQLEGSKVFAKEFMLRRNIPTATFKSFEKIEEAREFVNKTVFPIVIKADGLAAGKGVFICKDLKEGREAIDQIMAQKVFKSAGDRVVIEEYLEGEEASILAISDGEDFVMLDSAQDHKRIFDDDVGPNTGGMGAYSPAPVVSDAMLKKVEARIIEPTIRGMLREGIPFKGVLYAGLMITADGPKVLEFNVRFGDPEAQAVLPRLKNDLFDVMLAACEGRLSDVRLRWDHRSCVCVVMSSGGYPGKYETGYEITGLKQSDIDENADAFVFHAGTKLEYGKVLTAGGRVLGVTGLGDTITDAINSAYKRIDQIKFSHCFFRRDIGAKALKKPVGKSRVASRL